MTKEGSVIEYTIEPRTVRASSVVIGDGILDRLPDYFDFNGYSSLALITDDKVKNLYGQKMLKVLESTGKKVLLFTLPSGEKSKSLRTVERGYKFLLEHNVDRKGLICNLGGGAVGDTGGFIAATYLRGIDYVQLPTTLLAQVDSSIGGKVGINFEGKKNMVGSFCQPKAVISDVNLLKTLPPAEVRNGVAEVIKYAVAMDKELFRTLEQKGETRLTTAELKDIVVRCCRLKAAIVERDETERTGQRAILNFGHTVGHALEAAAKLRRLRHGEAVAIGMFAAAKVSERLGMLDRGTVRRIESLLLTFGLPTTYRGANQDDVLEAIRFDKKMGSGQTGWVLLKDIGEPVVNQTVAESLVRGVLTEILR